MSHTEDLESLSVEMERSLDADLRFVPTYHGVERFSGTGEVWFVGQKPSTLGFRDRAVEFVYELLADDRFAAAHITDRSKEVGGATDGIPPAEVDRNRPPTSREISNCYSRDYSSPSAMRSSGTSRRSRSRWTHSGSDGGVLVRQSVVGAALNRT